MMRALKEYRVGGVPTGVSFLRRLVSHPDFQAGRLHNRFLEESGLLTPPTDEEPAIALVGAALQALANNQTSQNQARGTSGRSLWKQAVQPSRYLRRW